ncbi:6-phosphogluconolactonase [soil metagenome]
MEIQIFPGQEELNHATAEIFFIAAREAIFHRNKFSVAFCGGITSTGLYEVLATSPYKEQVSCKDVHVFWTDEQWVFHNDLRNNAKMAFDLLLDHVPVPPQQICRISGELEPLDSAMQYEWILQEFFANEPPGLDLIYLNQEERGQTASLPPGSEVFAEEKHWVNADCHSEQKFFRIAISAPFISYARKIVCLIFGSEKAFVVKKLLAGNNFPKLPAELIAPKRGELIKLIDEKAASENY